MNVFLKFSNLVSTSSTNSSFIFSLFFNSSLSKSLKSNDFVGTKISHNSGFFRFSDDSLEIFLLNNLIVLFDIGGDISINLSYSFLENFNNSLGLVLSNGCLHNSVLISL